MVCCSSPAHGPDEYREHSERNGSISGLPYHSGDDCCCCAVGEATGGGSGGGGGKIPWPAADAGPLSRMPVVTGLPLFPR